MPIARTSSTHKPPLLVILGATGTGKSKLAVELATRFNGEIINADAVQMYKGLPIVTNKIPKNERNGIPHHLLDQIELDQPPWTVHHFVKEGSRIIEEIRARDRLPIVVGGTNYYVFSLLFEGTIVSNETSDSNDDETPEVNGSGMEQSNGGLSLLDAPTDHLYAKLQEIDPEIARSRHPKDRRKIQRLLQIWFKTGKTPSQIYAEQRAEKEKMPEAKLRYDPLVFWLDADFTILKERLNARVEVMVNEGLLDEVKTMRVVDNDMIRKGIELDKSKGIWVAIGYKELTPWLDALEESGDVGKVDKQRLLELRTEGIEAVKAGTRQYAKRQDRWIRIRLADHLQNESRLDRLFLLDGTDLNAWEANVSGPSEDVVGKFLADEDLPRNMSLSDRASKTFEAISSRDDGDREARFCETCQKTLMGEREWEAHFKSQSHKKVLDGIRKRALRDEYLAKRKLQEIVSVQEEADVG